MTLRINAVSVFRREVEGTSHESVGDRIDIVHADSGVGSC